MAKRFTDTGKWDKAWFRKLGSKLRDLRAYILDRCDHAGIIELDLETFEHYIGEPVSIDEISSALRGNLTLLDDKIFVPDFIEFQYKVPIEGLNPENKVHFSILQRLKNLGLSSPLQGAKDKEKEKDTDKDQEKEEDRVPQDFSLDAKTKEIFDRIPVITRDTLSLKYPSPLLSEGLEECVSYHINDPAAATWPASLWGKKFTSWMIDKKRRDKGKPKSTSINDLVLPDMKPKETA